jgi:hypothetical protein
LVVVRTPFAPYAQKGEGILIIIILILINILILIMHRRPPVYAINESNCVKPVGYRINGSIRARPSFNGNHRARPSLNGIYRARLLFNGSNRAGPRFVHLPRRFVHLPRRFVHLPRRFVHLPRRLFTAAPFALAPQQLGISKSEDRRIDHDDEDDHHHHHQ